METTAKSIEDAVSQFIQLRGYQPYRFSGVWYILVNENTYTAYRTKKAAANHTKSGSVWKIHL